MRRAEAEAAGFTVDEHCNPPVAYKGPRFSPLELIELEREFTDEEFRVEAERRSAERDNVSFADIGREYAELIKVIVKVFDVSEAHAAQLVTDMTREGYTWERADG